MQGVFAIAKLSKRLIERLRNPEYRSAYVAENVRTRIAYQIRALRAQRGWQQKTLAEKMGKPQSVVSRLEDPDYGKPSVQTLLEVAAAFDVALVIELVSFRDFLNRTRDASLINLRAPSFDEKHLTSYTTISYGLPFHPGNAASTGTAGAGQIVAAISRSSTSLEAAIH